MILGFLGASAGRPHPFETRANVARTTPRSWLRRHRFTIDVLLGAKTEKVERNRHDRLPTFGVGTELDERRWRGVVRQLVARGYLKADVDGYNTLSLTDRARPVLRGEERIELRLERERAKGSARKKRSTVAVEGSVFPEERLFERLRAMRTELAKA